MTANTICHLDNIYPNNYKALVCFVLICISWWFLTILTTCFEFVLTALLNIKNKWFFLLMIYMCSLQILDVNLSWDLWLINKLIYSFIFSALYCQILYSAYCYSLMQSLSHSYSLLFLFSPLGLNPKIFSLTSKVELLSFLIQEGVCCLPCILVFNSLWITYIWYVS